MELLQEASEGHRHPFGSNYSRREPTIVFGLYAQDGTAGSICNETPRDNLIPGRRAPLFIASGPVKDHTLGSEENESLATSLWAAGAHPMRHLLTIIEMKTSVTQDQLFTLIRYPLKETTHL
jgi:hypothetical protein